MIEITESASRVISRQLLKQAKPGGGLRIAVKAGGCSGFSYTFAWDETARDNDQVFEGIGGAKVFVDPRSLKLLDGTVLDFDEHRKKPDGDEFYVEESACEEHLRMWRILFRLKRQKAKRQKAE